MRNPLSMDELIPITVQKTTIEAESIIIPEDLLKKYIGVASLLIVIITNPLNGNREVSRTTYDPKDYTPTDQ